MIPPNKFASSLQYVHTYVLQVRMTRPGLKFISARNTIHYQLQQVNTTAMYLRMMKRSTSCGHVVVLHYG